MQHKDNDQIFGYTDLHNHLYGCLSAETLYRIGRKNPNPRWNLFLDSYKEAFGKTINADTFFQDYKSLEDFSRLYYFNERGPFSQFQAKFNLIIALVEFSIQEMQDIAYEVAKQHSNQGVRYSEYRIMFAKDEIRSVFEDRIRATCEGVRRAESDQLNQSNPIRPRIAYSLHRSGNYLTHYEWLKELMEKDPIVRKYLVGLDFCYIEEGYPPKDKKDFFERVHRDNKAEQSTALSILYHVGESYQDKTAFSASRWILESAEYGAHRLGHCIALGIRPETFKNVIRRESIPERIDQLKLELEVYDKIRDFGEYFPKSEIEKNLKSFLDLNDRELKGGHVEITFRDREVEYLRTFQEFCMDRISKLPSVIESCPSSNYYIGMIEKSEDHPLPRFLSKKLKVTISTDDPGIFNTDIHKEYDKARKMSIPEYDLESVRIQSFEYTSEILSGRV